MSYLTRYFMFSNILGDELLWAATWLYKAKGGKNYLNYVISKKDWSQAVNEFTWDNKFAGIAKAISLNSITEFYNGENDLEKFKTDVESFVCALMLGSSSQQVKPTPGKFSRWHFVN
ncbi:glycosyl hydrolase 9B9 protein [Arabidopsis thaliana]|uniref:cellulase n=1 Tax=Arabidopsis thaliana TaxID=3702 RepID=A0A1I9LLR3_ARATH|nr:glycosyl hydrolase 9B9 protein [Arabidopsis thaliana]ANM63521.1 glycosyl hydrolase 9B9 protein [Arabidopsis thaliana]|eukprot:NP_001325604.1 glycosyl hydrolase 9B9 protein [Arabidopsis thaliana]